MAIEPRVVVPRAPVSLAVEPALRVALPGLAAGRVVVIDYFASRRCSVVIGDLTGAFEAAPPGPGYAELAPLEGVRIFVESRSSQSLAPVPRSGSPDHRSLGISRSDWMSPIAGLRSSKDRGFSAEGRGRLDPIDLVSTKPSAGREARLTSDSSLFLIAQ